ncbi:small subunit rRNA processing factor, putative [Plasmodium berghei]|uniref:Small subunit rRNA processing factor, putative n=2 Tax=Plasmodium berghei TaxID=5821 RepID=A0A509AFI8_PLABA|nr:small subunit rRNA processing factor, putative [Plasmodium berghei ANKA]CXI16398.1 small subunit rRNA processing factor, putative [Plasmodium berghei]SCM19623.1 small subunit rRNA processing factor, putative [Plasmodium berghei]SCN23366.1 small subunit rRNA processing factor, putative [Plasmodium berghei]SCO59046.1 small subunit rRNA processing factor, putative [Plasmodium berghei]SCO59630.1 small subunit rRNA processing factor, putative [Plasmodium berghei]|eukprot:XP_034420558.1 small subunit rRNA processing factor, putative [Plasmodium berghei ANKA]
MDDKFNDTYNESYNLKKNNQINMESENDNESKNSYDLSEKLDNISNNIEVNKELPKKKKYIDSSDDEKDIIMDSKSDYKSLIPPRKKIKNTKKEDNSMDKSSNEMKRFDSDRENDNKESDKKKELFSISKKNKGNINDIKNCNNSKIINSKKRGICKKEEKVLKKKRSIKDDKNSNIIRDSKGEGMRKIDINNVMKKKKKKKDKNKSINGLNVKNNKIKKSNKETNKYNKNVENIKMTFDVTNRFTVLGCDWDNITSADIFYLFESYYNFEKGKKQTIDYSKSRAVKKVTIYTSKYGEKKLKYEQEHGPLIKCNGLNQKGKNGESVYRTRNVIDCIKDDEEEEDKDENEELEEGYEENSDDEDEENNSNDADSDDTSPMKDKFSHIFKKGKNNNEILSTGITEEENEQIRLYQIQRSRYYFALVECHNKEIVEFLYEELNDMDADFCINYLDLRIIDDNCSLDDYKIKESCDKIPENYQFHYSVSTVLKHTRVKSSWDENPKRKKLLSTRFTEEKLRELDLKEYLANSSDSESAYENNSVSANKNSINSKEDYRKLLLGDILADDSTKNSKKGTSINNNNDSFVKESDEIGEYDDGNDINIAFDDKVNNDWAYMNSDKDSISDEDVKDSFVNTNNKYNDSNNFNKKSKAKGKFALSDNESDKENEVIQVFKNMLKTKENKKDNKTPWEKYLDKVKEKKKLKKKAYLESLKQKDEEIKKIITKKTIKRKKDGAIRNNNDNVIEKIKNHHVLDGRFADLIKNKDFNLDITNPNYKKTKFNEEILKKKKL